RRVATSDRHHGKHLVLLDELLDGGKRLRRRMAVVFENGDDLAAVNAARRVDFLDRQHHAVAACESDVGRGPCYWPVRADRDRVRRHALLLTGGGYGGAKQRRKGDEQQLFHVSSHGLIRLDKLTVRRG